MAITLKEVARQTALKSMDSSRKEKKVDSSHMRAIPRKEEPLNLARAMQAKFKKLGVQQKAQARYLGITETTLSNYYNSSEFVPEKHMRKLRKLALQLEQVFEGKELVPRERVRQARRERVVVTTPSTASTEMVVEFLDKVRNPKIDPIAAAKDPVGELAKYLEHLAEEAEALKECL